MEDSFTTEVASTKTARKNQRTENVPAKKELRIRRSKNAPALFEVYFEDGGQLPVALSGKYIREQHAQVAIDRYLAGR
jgi:hypothetical protein